MQRELALVARGLSTRAPNGDQLLDDVSFAVPRGSLVGIVGPTGAGKTSLVNALSGALLVSSGRIEIGGEDVSGHRASDRGIGVVAQEDRLHGQLSLRRTLEHAARLRLGRCRTRKERDLLVGEAIAAMGLTRQADVRVSSLSVGQRKRANIAAELVGQPDVLILDEPTSSLDPGYERTVMGALRRLTEQGRTVVAVTHSMQAASRCDLVLFMAAGGQVAYFGPPAEASEYFGEVDSADLFAALNGDLDTSPTRWWNARFRSDPAYFRYAAPAEAQVSPLSKDPVSRRSQLWTLVRRYAELILADRRHSAMIVAQGLVVGTLIWTFLGPHGLARPHGIAATLDPTAVSRGVAALLGLSMMWLGSVNSAREVVKEREILVQESGAGLSISSYVLSKLGVLGLATVVQAVLLTWIATLRQSPPAHGAVFGSGMAEVAVTMAVTGVSAVALGLLISSFVKSADKAMAIVPMVVVAEFMLSGLEPSVRWIPGISQLRDLSGSYWAVRAISATVTGDARTWWASMLALSALTTGATLLAGLMVRRGLRPDVARPHRRLPWPPTMLLARVRPTMTGVAGAATLASARLQLTTTGQDDRLQAPAIDAALTASYAGAATSRR